MTRKMFTRRHVIRDGLAVGARIRASTEARYPGDLRVAPPPRLLEMNADAVAREIAAP